MKTMFLFAAALLVLFAASMSRVSAQVVVGDVREPPLEGFIKTVSPTTAIAGDTVHYVIRFANPVSATYTATVVMSDTLDPRLSVNAASRTALTGDGSPIGEFQNSLAGSQVVSWSAEIVPGDEVTITFDVTVALGFTAAEVITNEAKLYEVGFETATLTASATLLLRPFAMALPIVARGLEPFPTLVNGDFELGPGVGWRATPSYVIYAYSDIAELSPPGGNRANRYMAWLGGENNATNKLVQAVTVPRGYTSAGLHYKYWIASQESACDQDTATLTVSTRAPATLVVYPIQLCRTQNTLLPGRLDGWRENQIDLSALIAQVASPTADIPLTITLEAVLNGSLISNLWIEDVVLCSDQAGAVDAHPCTGELGGR